MHRGLNNNNKYMETLSNRVNRLWTYFMRQVILKKHDYKVTKVDVLDDGRFLLDIKQDHTGHEETMIIDKDNIGHIMDFYLHRVFILGTYKKEGQ